MEIIRHAIDSMPDLEPGQLILKNHGRHRAYNATRLLRELAGSTVDVAGNMRMNLSEADSRLFGITVKCALIALPPRQEMLDDLSVNILRKLLRMRSTQQS